MAIVNFKDQITEEIANNIVNHNTLRRLPYPLFGTAIKKLAILDSALDLGTLRSINSLRLELLKGDRKDQFSIRINIKYRICFIWEQGDAYDVEIIDYH